MGTFLENKIGEKVNVKENKQRKEETKRLSTVCTIFASSCESAIISK